MHLKAGVDQGGTAGKKMTAIAHAMAITLPKPPAEPPEAHRPGTSTRPLNLTVGHSQQFKSHFAHGRDKRRLCRAAPGARGQ